MAFEQDLRAYLEAREHESSSYSTLPRRRIDVPELHRHFLDRLRTMEKSGQRNVVENLFDEWSKKLERFARYIETLPKAIAPVDRHDLLIFARRALDAAIEYPDPDLPLVERLEMQRVAQEFIGGHALALSESYALENRLVRGGYRRRTRLTELGRVFLQLRGKDAVRWLMTNELVQGAGPFDPWHVSRELLQEVMTTRGVTPLIVDRKGIFQYSYDTLTRLAGLGVFYATVDGPEEIILEFHAEPAMREVIEAVLESGPWHTAVRALLDDERAFVLPDASGSATEATTEHTKLVVHEV
ncbi:MAG TPA: hypothetical protein VH165_31465, partial [Kofleriaceae bacterium]|nr:hypothetical protein [Kofleriaceae bacterium]